jgi:carbamoyltransferase
MLILGIHGDTTTHNQDDKSNLPEHDSAAILMRDGELLAAVEEERLDRIKHSGFFPSLAIRHCLSAGGVSFADIDRIVFHSTESAYYSQELKRFIYDPRRPFRPTGKELIASLFQDQFQVDVADKIRFCNHHLAHAWSAFGQSGFDDSLILTLDGTGDNSSGLVLIGHGREIQTVREFHDRHSLGHFYFQTSRLLGYTLFDEYKVMGLAPYGRPGTYAEVLARCFTLLPEGNYELLPMRDRMAVFAEAGLLCHTRAGGEPLSQVHKDIAAALQAALEKIVFHILTFYRQATGMRNLCLAGGVAHNCALNGKILYSGLFERAFVQPAAHDAGGPLGAAQWILREERQPVTPKRLTHVFLGPALPDEEGILECLRGWRDLIGEERPDDIIDTVARLIADGAVVGWVQGRSEFGPRALGNRSILADPRRADYRARINQMIKTREGYRPFAPAVVAERIWEFFSPPATQADLSFMLFTIEVRERFRSQLGAVTHLDGTARVQTVTRESNALFWSLLDRFGELTGFPILLNTSFNNNVEPIVDSIDDAITCFLTTGLDFLVIGERLIRKRATALDADSAWSRGFIPRFAREQKLLKRYQFDTSGNLIPAWTVESTSHPLLRRRPRAISEDAFSLLAMIDGGKNFADLLCDARLDDPARASAVLQEVVQLWHERVLGLAPDRRRLT